MKNGVMRGFSLTELMIVLTVVGILLSMALPGFEKQVSAVSKKHVVVMLMAMQGQLERYLYDHGSYPKSLSAIPMYSEDTAKTQDGKYEISLELSSDCPAESCYTLRAKHINATSDGDLTLYSSGELVGH